jgi:ribosome-binding protein aMBF1 (putative translation factor)
MRSRSSTELPAPVKEALKKLGSDINEARRRRGISTTAMSDQAKVSRGLLVRVEKGDATVALGGYASVLFVLGMTERVTELADVTHDQQGLELERQNLPKRIHTPPKQRKQKRDT